MAGINNNDKAALLYAKEKKDSYSRKKKEEKRGESKKKPFLKRGEKKESQQSHITWMMETDNERQKQSFSK